MYRHTSFLFATHVARVAQATPEGMSRAAPCVIACGCMHVQGIRPGPGRRRRRTGVTENHIYLAWAGREPSALTSFTSLVARPACGAGCSSAPSLPVGALGLHRHFEFDRAHLVQSGHPIPWAFAAVSAREVAGC